MTEGQRDHFALCGQVATQALGLDDDHNSPDEVRVAIEQFMAIVAKLPVTADGVPVMPEMTVWYLWPDTASVCEAVRKHRVMAVYADGASLRGVYHAPVGSYGDTPIPWSELFSTYEAGKAAEQKARTPCPKP